MPSYRDKTKEDIMFKLYRRSQEVQWNWIRNHPVQYVALNAAIMAVGYVYIQYWDRKLDREIKKNEEMLRRDFKA
jgi:hypothetical protein